MPGDIGGGASKTRPTFAAKGYVGSNSKPILQEGAIYIRDLAAKTVVVGGPDHWNAILKRGVAQKQTELVEHVRSLLAQLGLAIPSGNQDSVADEDFKLVFRRVSTWKDCVKRIGAERGSL